MDPLTAHFISYWVNTVVPSLTAWWLTFFVPVLGVGLLVWASHFIVKKN